MRSRDALSLVVGLLGLGGCLLPGMPIVAPAGGQPAASPAEGGGSGEPTAASGPGGQTPTGPGVTPTAPAAPAAPAPPATVSVTIKNECRQSVRLFFGDKPKFGSGTYSSVSSNSLSSRSLSPGDMIWIVDDRDNGVSSLTVGEHTGRVEILESCSGLRAQ